MCSQIKFFGKCRNHKRTHYEKKNRKIDFVSPNIRFQPYDNFNKINFKSFNKWCYQQCLSNKIDNLFTILPIDCERISYRRRSYMTCQIYKILKKHLPISICDNNKHVIIKQYLSHNNEYWDYIKYKTLSEVFFQTLTFNETDIQTPQIYFWGYNSKLKHTYIIMFYIDKNMYHSIKDVSSTPKINALTEKYFSKASQEFKKHNFYHNDLINKGNIFTNKHSPFEGQKMSYVIDFGEADVCCQNPFDRRSPVTLLKKDTVI